MVNKIKETLGSKECEYFSIAFLYHCCIIGLLAICFVAVNKNDPVITIVINNDDSVDIDSTEIIEIDSFDDKKTSITNDNNPTDNETSFSIEQTITPPSSISLENYSESSENTVDNIGDNLLSSVDTNIGDTISLDKSTASALDRLTAEIAANSEEHNLHVIWLMDASISLFQQRKDIAARFNKILTELECIRNPSNIIVHSIFSYGKSCNKICDPTDDANTLFNSLYSIDIDLSGVENTFQSVHELTQQYGKKDPKLMIVVFTDETGDDLDWLNKASLLCRQKSTPIYVVGVPAPFGKSKAEFKYVDPDENYDQTERWVEIQQGPETLYPMVLDLRTLPIDDEVLDSGFGPFGLCSLCSETGGIYFSVHPNRNNTRISKKDISPLSSNISVFFDKNDMLKFKPDYRSPQKQTQEINTHKIKKSLINACSIPLYFKDEQIINFRAFNEGEFVDQLNRAQRFAAKIEPQINQVYMILQENEKDFNTLKESRWIASYALAMGRILATKSRIELYNQMLAEAKTGLIKQDPKTNSWVLNHDSNFTTKNSQITKTYEKAMFYLNMVINNYPNTPWAYIANKEITTPFGYKWTEQYIEPPKTNTGGNNNPNIPNPKDDTIKKLQPKPQRKIEKI